MAVSFLESTAGQFSQAPKGRMSNKTIFSKKDIIVLTSFARNAFAKRSIQSRMAASLFVSFSPVVMVLLCNDRCSLACHPCFSSIEAQGLERGARCNELIEHSGEFLFAL